jgi:tetratricopeptide (TPR) repeat protein
MRILLLALFTTLLAAQQTSPGALAERPNLSAAEAPLAPVVRAHLEQAIRARDYLKAEDILVHEIDRNPGSPQLLTLAAGVFFLDGKYLNTAIAMKKAEAIAPLDDQSRFTLAMSYVVMDHRDWARPELEKLSQKSPLNPLYLYWLARLDYDVQGYAAAIEKLERVIAIDPRYMKAYDNLGLCYEAAGRLDDAVKTYQRAVDLNRQANPVSPWPPLNLGSLLVKLEQLDDAEKYLRDSLLADPRFAQTHYVFGTLLEKRGRDEEAIRELEQAAALDAAYAQPHYALGRIYRRAGNITKAAAELNQFEKLREAKPEKRPQ